MKDLRIHIIIITVIIVVLIGVGAQRLLYMQKVERPLNEMFLSIDGVKSYELLENPSGRELVVTVEPVEDLQTLYQEIHMVSRRVLGENISQIRLVDRPNSRLKAALYQAHYAIQEGIATGRFTEMSETVREVMASEKISNYRLTVGYDNVYLQMIDGGYFIYSIFPRVWTAGKVS